MNTQAIIDRMNVLGLNYRTLATKSGVSAKVLQNVIEGRDVMLFFDTLKVARFLGLSLDNVLLDGKVNMANNLTELVIRYCKIQDWELPEFASQADINTKNLRNFISGTQQLGNGEAVKIAQVIGISVDELAAVCTGEKSAADVIDAARQEAGNEQG